MYEVLLTLPWLCKQGFRIRTLSEFRSSRMQLTTSCNGAVYLKTCLSPVYIQYALVDF